MERIADAAHTLPTATTGAWPALTVAVVCVIVGLLDYRPLHDPLTNDAALFSIVSRVTAGETTHPAIDLAHGRGIWHPMLYQESLNGIARAVGSDLLYARLFGLLCGLVTAGLVAALTVLLVPPGPWRHWAAVLGVAAYVTNPFGRLGMLHLDIDNTVMPPILLSATICLVLLTRRVSSPRLGATVVTLAAAFWTKLTTPLLLPLSLGLRLWLEGRGREAWRLPLAVALGGLVLFATTWWGYCWLMGYPPTGTLLHIHRALQRHAALADAVTVVRNAVGVLYWLNPAFLLLAAFGTALVVREIKTSAVSRDLLVPACLAWTILLAYLFVGGLTFTIPKYQYPAIPLLAVIVGAVLARRLSSALPSRWWPVGLLAATVYYASIGDPLYDFFYGARQYLWQHNLNASVPKGYLPVLAGDLTLVLAPVLVWLLIAWRLPRPTRQAAVLVGLTVLMFGYNLGLGLTQARADYVTTYSYGTHGAQGLLDRMRDRATVLLYGGDGAILGPWNTKRIQFATVQYHDDAQFAADQRSSQADYLVVGLPVNTVDQLWQLRNDPHLRAILADRFTEEAVGDFILFTRRGP